MGLPLLVASLLFGASYMVFNVQAKADELMDASLNNKLSQLQRKGMVSPTLGLTNQGTPQSSGSDIFNTLSEYRSMAKQELGPTAYDSDENDLYSDRRFDFLAAQEGFRGRVYKDTSGLRTVGYGINLDEPANKPLVMNVLKIDEEEYNALLNGEAALDEREARSLFEAAADRAETFVDHKLAGVDLTEHERLALVSLAYNSPSLIGPNLVSALKGGNKQEAIDEILYDSNRQNVRGIASRRYREAAMFAGADKHTLKLPSPDEYIPR